jgi:hypothetical protein
MARKLRVAALAGAAVALFVGLRPDARGDGPSTPPPPLRVPPLAASYPLPDLPQSSPRNANYTIEARLDPANHTIEGKLVLEWRNLTDRSVDDFPFHLYWNAFRNNLSTSARGEGRRAARAAKGAERERGFGWIHVKSIRLLDEPAADLMPSLEFIHPDDDNSDDRTVMQVKTPRPFGPGATARFAIEWSARIPFGDVGRSGWVHDYNFIAQWFPKLGVLQKDGWNCHEFHPWSEFFSDYGVYDVKLTLPAGFVVGATGRFTEKTTTPDGQETFHFVQEDVHDFAWVASRRFLERKGRFDDPGYPAVEIRLLLQPEHAALADRYIEATKIALRSYGAWAAPYPYPQITVVDPAWRSASGGMEYPTLFTGGASLWAPPALQSPEGVTIHECGHQFWYGLVGTNEFEEAWLDEGFNTYHEQKAAFIALGPEGYGHRYFGVSTPGRGTRGGIPVVAPGVFVGRGESDLPPLRRNGETDVMARRAWDYRTAGSYSLNSYGKPALSLQTLEALVGDDTMTRILRSYARRYRFAHPTSRDFIAVVNEVTGQDWQWYFDETWYSSELCDYAITAKNERVRVPEGFLDGPAGSPPVPAPSPAAKGDDSSGPWESEVTVERLGGVRLPVEVVVEFADGRSVRESWDGKERWTRFRYTGLSKLTRALVDPDHKIALDVDPSNNSWRDEHGVSRRGGEKWGGRYLFLV